MSEIRVNRLSNELNTGGPTLSGITTFSGQQYFVPPSGSTAERPSDCPPGSIRFNTDSAHLEYWDGLQWLEFEATSEELGGGTGSNTGLGTRGIIAGGYTNPGGGNANTDTIDFVTISTLGNAQDFGNYTISTRGLAGCASRTRGVFGGGGEPGNDTIAFVTIASTGNATDFGNLTSARTYLAGVSNQTRGIWGGGATGPSAGTAVDVIDYVTIASTGNAVDFGNLLISPQGISGCSSPVRGIFNGGEAPGNVNTIEYITISTTGDAQDFGDLTRAVNSASSASNSTRGLCAGGGAANTIDFITIATTGNAQDFGDLTVARGTASGTSSSTRAIFCGGNNPTNVNTIDFVTILTTGNASDFGDLNSANRFLTGACSNGHGGL